MTQEQTLSTVNNITGVLTITLGGIAAISLIVGGIGVIFGSAPAIRASRLSPIDALRYE